MKRRFTLLLTAALMLMSGIVWAQTKTSVTDVLTRESTGVTSTSYASWSNVTSNSDAVYAGQSAGGNESIQLRSNNNNSGIITTASGGTVSSVSVSWHTATADNRTLQVYGSDSEYTSPTELYNSNTQGTLLGTIVKGTSTTLTIEGSYPYIGLRSANGAMYLSEIDITWTTGGSQQTVATPTFNPAGGTYTQAQNVTIACATEGATIYYTTDGTTPSVAASGINGSPYTTPIPVSETTTVKAIAVKEGMSNSNVASATYTFPTVYTTIPDLFNAATSSNTNVVVTFNNWVVTGVSSNGKNVFVTDGTNGFFIYSSSGGLNNTYAVGNTLSGTASCVLKLQNGSAQLSNVDATALTIGTGGTVDFTNIAMADLTGLNTGALVHFENLVCSIVTGNNNKYYLSDGTTTLQVYNSLYPNSYDNLVDGQTYNISGVYQQYNTTNAQTKEVLPRGEDDIEEVLSTVATPTFSPEEGTYTEEIMVAIECETEGATIHYTLDGTDPTANSAVFAEAFPVSETTTIKAFATKEGMTDSEIATAVYTMQIAPTPTGSEYVHVTELSQIGIGSKVIIAARYNENTNEYYAMTAQASGKPVGVPFTSVIDAVGESAPSTLATDTTMRWTVNISGNNYTFTNANGDVLGYTSGTNFATGGDNTAWTIVVDTAASAAMVPDYIGFVVSNGNSTNRAIALNNSHNFGPYAKSNMSSANYNFILDFFSTEGTAPVPVVATPTFTPEGGTYTEAQTVTIACATEGATIHYTLDGTDPTANSPVYATGITVSETTTIKAFATKEGMTDSEIASATYTIEATGPTLVTIAAARALDLNEYALVQGVVTFIDGRNVYVQDETAGIDLFLNSNTVPTALALGDLVQAYGKRAAYNGLVELSGINGNDPDQFSIISSGNTLPVAIKTIAEILADFSGANALQSTRVKIEGAVIGAINTNNNTPISQGESSMNIYKIPVVEGLLEGDSITVTGVIGCFNAVQLRVALASDVLFTHPTLPTVATPTFTPAAGTYYEAQSVTIACATEGATIHYTLDGTDPTANSPVYTTAIAISATTTVKAFATKEGMTDSEIATAVYTITEAPVGSDYTRITSLSQLGNGSQVVIAARYNTTANEYYAMTAQTTGKPAGVLFTSVPGTNGEVLPTTIVDDTFLWTVTTDGSNYTFTTANGDVLGYTSGTNFATGGDNTAWTIVADTAAATAMVPEYIGFVVTNGNSTGRAIALNSSHNYGPYAKSNMSSENYNFILDFFATESTVTPVCATPTFNPAAGTYYETQNVTIACATEGATIHYTLDGTDPTANSAVYAEPIVVAENVTIKAIAMKEGFDDSAIAEAQYTIILGAVTIFNQDWEGDMNGWTFVSVEGNKPWNVSQYQGNHYAYANGYNGGVNEQWCISPAFSLVQYSNVTLNFRNAKNYNGPDLQLFFSNDYDGSNPATATWTELTFEKSTGSFAWAESGTIEFTGFAGTDCYIGFKYTSTETEAAAWEVDDVVLMGFTSDPYLNVTPTALTGFTHVVNEGPSASQTFTLTAGNISPAPGGTTGSINVSVFSPFEISLDDEDYGDEIFFEDITNLEPTTIYVRMNGTEVGQYTETVNIYASSGDEATVTLSGTVTEPIQGSDWNRIGSLADLQNGAQVVLAARYDATVGDGYYAMTAGVSGKPDGVLFTSVNENGIEMLPDDIVADIATFAWNVTVNDTIITLTNASGDMLGYSSSTNFAGNTSTDWSISNATSGDNAMVPNYTGFVITNVETNNRCIVMNASHKFGAYHTSNINNGDYNFYLDLFVQGGSASQTVATPVFSMSSGTYYEEIDVEITCATDGATIYYTTDGNEPTIESTVYTEPIHVAGNMTLKAFAVKEGFDDSNVATANYVVFTNVAILLTQNWEGEMNGWTFVTVEGNKPWNIATHNGNQYAYANGYGDDVDNEQWCISPAFDLTQFAGRNVTLTFMNAKNYSGPDLELFFANDYDGQDPESASWVPLTFNMSTGGYAWTESGPISLNAFSGTLCNIGFRYTSTVSKGAAAWEIDDVMLIADIIDEPYLMATPNALTGFSHQYSEEPSASQTFVLSGGNLPTDADTQVYLKVVDAWNQGFLISDDDVTYGNVLTLTPVNGALQPTTIYVRLYGHEVGTVASTIDITCADLYTSVSLEGEVLPYDEIYENLVNAVTLWNTDEKIVLENLSGNTLQMVVYNLLGQPVMSNSIATGSNTVMHNLAKGMYVITLQNNRERMSAKMIVR
ncbi:MAG: chitobiase/beta-hexosaminidase C-terminal domain-containing protein [Bacteroidales bacterium]|nr:chitobiase/beta-hexosaminidase C-terminal domain-containing protein [Bacteroidales bacterium]